MQHAPVTSSFVTHVGYDPITQHLEFTFKNGTRERHEHVTPDQHAAIMSAPSIGKHWNQVYKGRGTKVSA